MRYKVTFKCGRVEELESLRGADLREADLRRASLSRADLRRADLSRVKHSLDVLKNINGLEWDIVLKNDLVRVGCQEHSLSKWLEFSEEEIEEMDTDKAVGFYSTLMINLQYAYKESNWSEMFNFKVHKNMLLKNSL
jgi:uncharacterized protein YjbI with pentapeptide repeats